MLVQRLEMQGWGADESEGYEFLMGADLFKQIFSASEILKKNWQIHPLWHAYEHMIHRNQVADVAVGVCVCVLLSDTHHSPFIFKPRHCAPIMLRCFVPMPSKCGTKNDELAIFWSRLY